MRPTNRNGTAHVTEAKLFRERSSPLRGVAADLAARLEQSHMALAELRKMLVASEQQTAAARQTLEELTEANSGLRQELIRLTRREARANHFASHDPLTGLPNRRLLLDRLKQAIALAARGHRRVALLFFDLDDFKRINDSLGHASGDKILIQVARRLADGLRSADTACRYGGDEFIVMLPEIDGEESAGVVAQKIQAQLLAPYLVDYNTVTMTVSMGAAVYPLDGRTSRDLIRQADSAMYRAKAGADAAPENAAD